VVVTVQSSLVENVARSVDVDMGTCWETLHIIIVVDEIFRYVPPAPAPAPSPPTGG
jgi:hypothetical protein